jgi:putative serine protease PepD
MSENREPHPVPPVPPAPWAAAPLPPYGPTPPYGPAPDAPALPVGPGDTRPARRRTAAVAVGAALLVATAGISGAGGAALALSLDDRSTTVTASPVVAGTASAPTGLAKVAAAVQPSVVSIAVQGSGTSGEGSGVILRSDGLVLTNNHVVASAANGGSLRVTFSDGRSAAASIVGRAPSDDLAVIRVRGVSGLTPATLGESSALHVGDTVLAIGSPLGLEGSVTSGIVSALDRTITLGGEQSPVAQSASTVVPAIQTDAAINPGNSGGPLVDARGRVIGITTAIATTGGQQSGSIGLGFAIPVDSAKRIADSLAAGKQPQHAALGVQVTDGQGGALVSRLTDGSAAAKAGLRAGDLITAVDRTQVDSGSALSAAVRAHAPGDKVTVTYTRGGRSHEATTALGTAAS